jgi:ubiquinol-cytochrome c reductase cytochrome c1 subunit
MSMVAYRDLASTTGPHFTADEVKALAADATISDPSVESGSRPGRPYDYIPPAPPFPGGHPPDLSLIAKARAVERGFPTFVFDFFTQYQEGGPDYVYSFVTGFQDAPADVKVPDGLNYNPYFISSSYTAMPPPLTDGQVHYAQNADEDKANDVPETVDQYGKDVTAFLMWSAEPHLVERKAMGLTVMVFLVIFACLVYYTKKKVWAAIPGEA